MPGYELVGKEEQKELNSIFSEGAGVLFRHSFDTIRGNSYKVKTFEENFAKSMNSSFGALAVSSGTAALRVALAALNLKEGDEVITQAFTFVATVEAIIESRAKPICTEIDDTLNMDPEDLLNKITENTKAVIVVHMLGVPARIDRIKEICERKNIALIEDAAWGCGAKFKDKPLGTWGDMGAFSFDFAKTITTGEGGMILFNHKRHHDFCCAWHDHGHENNPEVPRWEDTRSSSGFNYRMSELQGAVGISQLKKLDFIVSSQRRVYDSINCIVNNFSHKNIFERTIPNHSFISADAYIFRTDSKEIAINCRKELLKESISTKILPEAITWHFAGSWNHMPELENPVNPLHTRFSKSEKILRTSVSIPIFINTPKDFYGKIERALNNSI